jgi:mono/diheme cytochrome c family protein
MMTKKLLCLLFILLSASLCGCDYARMYDQESVRTYKKEMPGMDERSIPVRGGFQNLLAANPKTLHNPVPSTEVSLEEGRQAYGYFCMQCHGPNADGMGTVGQSFSPLPTDLKSHEVQSQTDGELYAKIRLGYKRHPQLYTTVAETDTWAIVNYLKSLAPGR